MFTHNFGNNDENLNKARIDEGKTPEEKRAARAERQSSWERKDYGMISGASQDPEISRFKHRAKLQQIRSSPTPKLTKGKIGPKCKQKLKAYSRRKGWQYPSAVVHLQAGRICGSKTKSEDSENDLKKDLRRWVKEKWANPKGETHHGSGKSGWRPTVKVSEKTPDTWGEMSSHQKKKKVENKRKANKRGGGWSTHESGRKQVWNTKKGELEKALPLTELKDQGYSFKILKPTKSGRGFAVTVHHNRRRVGHAVFESRQDSDGYHSVYNSNIDESHRGKGLYQHMLRIGAEHVKSLGGKGLKSKGFQRSPDATRAWDKIATHAIDRPDVSRGSPQRRADYYLAANDLVKGLKGDWKKEGYTLKFHPPKVEMFNGKHDITSHRVTAHDSQGNRVGDYYFSEWPEASEHKGLLHVTFSGTDPDHQRKGLASAAYSIIEQRTGKKVHSSPGNRSADAKKLWAQPNRTFGKSLQKASLPSAPKVNLNPEHGKKIAEAYHNMKHDPNHPEVKAAYGALINETKQQFKDMLSQGFKFSAIKPDQENPYKTSKDLHADIKQNKHLHFFPTDQGFGSQEGQPANHPMLQPTEFMHEGKRLLANDLFRIVHDYRGHHLGGESTFGPKGEHQAYLTHKKDFSPLAQKALATETMGQNSWVTAGPYAEHNKKNPHQTIYAEQKAGLLPDDIINRKWHGEE